MSDSDVLSRSTRCKGRLDVKHDSSLFNLFYQVKSQLLNHTRDVCLSIKICKCLNSNQRNLRGFHSVEVVGVTWAVT